MSATDDSNSAPNPGPASAPDLAAWRAEPVDLDAWRAEAGEAVALADAAPIGPWEFGQRDGGFGGRWVTTQDICHCIIQLPEGAGPFIAASRTGWPRDAARVAELCAEVERLSALEAVAVKHHDACLGACGCGVCAWIKASRKEGATR